MISPDLVLAPGKFLDISLGQGKVSFPTKENFPAVDDNFPSCIRKHGKL